jgi:hypothetical protein
MDTGRNHIPECQNLFLTVHFAKGAEWTIILAAFLSCKISGFEMEKITGMLILEVMGWKKLTVLGWEKLAVLKKISSPLYLVVSESKN